MRRRRTVAEQDRRHLVRRRRRRRIVRGILRPIVWLLVLAGVFVLGVGVGRVAGSDSSDSSDVTLERDLGTVVATQPTETVVETETVVKRVRVRARRR